MESNILTLLSAAVLALFAGVWIWIGIKLLVFAPSKATPTLQLSQALVTVGGFLASAVGAGTASILGIEIQNVPAPPTGRARTVVGAQLNAAIQGSPVLMAGIITYALVGAFVLITWLVDSPGAPDVISAFSLGVLGWLAGAFAAVFRTSTT